MPIVLESVDVDYFIEMYCTVRLYDQLALYTIEFFIKEDSELQLEKPLTIVECTSSNVCSDISAINTTVVELPTVVAPTEVAKTEVALPPVVDLPPVVAQTEVAIPPVVAPTEVACTNTQAADQGS